MLLSERRCACFVGGFFFLEEFSLFLIGFWGNGGFFLAGCVEEIVSVGEGRGVVLLIGVMVTGLNCVLV